MPHKEDSVQHWFTIPCTESGAESDRHSLSSIDSILLASSVNIVLGLEVVYAGGPIP